VAREVLVSDSEGRLWSSTDQAETFQLAFEATSAIQSVSVAFDTSWAIAAGDADAGIVFRTRDGAWQRAEGVPAGSWAAAMVSHDGRSGFVSGAGGQVLRTRDEGATFTGLDSRTALGLNALENMNGY
jgi:photosystem II stability/assembly factor-like uncharacterized protein